jgi:hypothetical protein
MACAGETVVVSARSAVSEPTCGHPRQTPASAIAADRAAADDKADENRPPRPGDVAMELIWIAIGIALAAVWVITVFDILRRHLGAGKTAAWLLIVILLPFIGALAYWVMRKPTAEEVQRSAEAADSIRSERAGRSVDSTRF